MADNILVVEYEPRYADRVRQALTGHPYVPSFAKDGEEALRILQVQRPILVVVSSVLPKVSAPDLIRAIRSERGLQGTKILLTVAGYKGTSPAIDAQRLGASDILPKPYSETDFLAKVRQMLGTSGESDRAAVAAAAVAHAAELPPPAQGPPAQAPPAQAPPAPPAARATARPTADVDKLVADTLAGLMKQSRPAPAESKPKTHSGTTGLDRKVQDTLSGLEKSARRTSAPAAVAAVPPPPEEDAPGAEDQDDNVVLSQPVIAAPEPAAPEPEPEDDFAGDEALDGVKFGPYVLLEKIATGGMAEVWKARRRGVEGFQKTVAIKKILPHLSDNEEFVAMFVDEAKLAAQLNHSNIIHIYDLGKAEGSFYIAMEHVDGADLKTILRRGEDHGQPLTIELSLFIASKIAAALDFAHRKRDFEDRELGIVHRDVSPQNVLISVDGDIKLCDFGIAKAASKASHTQAGALKGKLQYMAPEQAWGRSIDRRTDVFALAVVLFEMLSGRKLFEGDNEMSLLDQVRQPRPVPPSNFNDEVPAEVDAIVLKALESEPERRYQTAGDMARDIDRVLYSLRPTPTAADLAIYMHHIAEPLPAARPAAAVEPEPEEEKPAAPAAKAAPVPQAATPAPLRVAPSEPAAERALPSMFAVPEKRKSPIVPISIAAGVVIVAIAAFLVMRSTGSRPAPAGTPTAAPTSTTAAAPAPLAAATTSSAQPQPAGVPAAAPSAAQPAIDAAQVDAEVQKRLGAERARLQQQMQPVSAPAPQQNAAASRPAVITPSPVAAAPPPTETRAAAPQPAPAAAQPAQPAPQPAQPASQPAPETPRVREGDLVAAGTEGLVPARMTRRATPTYPPIARMQRVEGTVVVNVLVSERGEVLDTRILSGVKRNVGLNEAALQAIRKSSFAAGTKDGVRVKSWTAVEVDFKL